ncbi:hypothetical protein SteCoe_11786 [Stentor coeruleus]|uniref:C3H1-type domain-containing protein n=1 Tax=Stentor coeruleus TaxID=5963 RepID=A0A1R2CCA3_9CILI|nr:hypothetical protein SteCoe_11786 [Stentor coeruleus]
MSNSPFRIPDEKTFKQQIDYKIKFKTELCRNWSIGMCEFGEKCTFAHGNHELRGVLNSNYRTKKCKQFHEKGYCQYGNRCLFKHRDDSAETAENSEASPSRSPRDNSSENLKKRLPVFLRIAPQD